MAIDASVKELYLYHHDPNYDDDAMDSIDKNAQQLVKERNSSMKCYIAKEGMSIEL